LQLKGKGYYNTVAMLIYCKVGKYVINLTMMSCHTI
jgi:hypothetical protein